MNQSKLETCFLMPKTLSSYVSLLSLTATNKHHVSLDLSQEAQNLANR